MNLPTFEDIMLPLLKFLSDKHEKNYSQIMDHLANYFQLRQEDLELEKLTGGTLFYNRIGWAKDHLTKAGLLDGKRGKFKISPAGLEILEEKPSKINRKYLTKFNEFASDVEKINISEITSEFREWLKSKEAIEQVKIVEKEKQEVQELMQELSAMDKTSLEFTDLVLYGLLPYHKSRFAKRLSTFPVFMNIKQFLKDYNYTDDDWNKIANMIYDLASKFQNDPNKLDQWIKNFASDKTHTRMIQCGSISPILFCINDSFPLINNKIRRTYNEFSRTFGWNDKISQKLEDYIDNVEKCRKLIDFLDINEVKDLTVFDLFCWWYDDAKKAEKIEEGDEDDHEGIAKAKLADISYEQFLPSVDLKNLKKLEPHILRNPERIKIRDLLQICKNGKWQLPNFQRYFDWKKTDIRDLLESIFRDFYLGSLLLWEVDREIPLKLIPILGVKLSNDDRRTDMIILDGQQRITSLYYAIKGVSEPTKKIKKPVYYYINFSRFLHGREEDNIEILEQKLSREESIRKLRFPFYELENYDAWIDSFEDFVGTQENYLKIKAIRRLMERKLKHFIDGFEIPYIVLPHTMELHQVTDIFERINTRGKTLSVFDILIATLSKYNIDLRQLWNDTERTFPKLKEYNTSDKLPIYILQSIALTNHDLSRCGREDLLKIYSTVVEPKNLSFEDIWEDMAQWVNRAILKLENLRDGYGVKDKKSLPYMPTIPILAALLKKMNSRSNKIDCNAKLDMWYWSSVFSEMYSSGVDTQLTTDYREMLNWFDDDTKPVKSVERFRREFSVTMNLPEIENKTNVVYRGILSLLALKGAPDFDTNLTLENASENDKHHIFPKKPFTKSKNVLSILNLTWMSDETNRKIIGMKKPSLYIKKFLQEKYNNDENNFLNVLEKHCINKKGYESMLQDDFVGFIESREKIFIEKIAELIGMKKPYELQESTMISPTTQFSNETAILNTILECKDYIYWFDKYFSRKGLEWLAQALENQKVRTIKILTTKNKSEPKNTTLLRKSFKKFRNEMKEKGVTCELRILTDSKTATVIHDRWIITKNTTYNLPSTDNISRGQVSTIYKDAHRPDFDSWWNKSLDIIDDWNKILS